MQRLNGSNSNTGSWPDSAKTTVDPGSLMHNGYGFMVDFPAMKRRDLLKALPVLPFFLNKMVAGGYATIESGRKAIMFVNTDLVPLDLFAKIKFPKEVLAICPIRVPEGKTMDDVIRIYETH